MAVSLGEHPNEQWKLDGEHTEDADACVDTNLGKSRKTLAEHTGTSEQTSLWGLPGADPRFQRRASTRCAATPCPLTPGPEERAAV